MLQVMLVWMLGVVMFVPCAAGAGESKIVKSVEMPAFTMCVTVEGSHAYVGYRHGFQVFDLSEPADPKLLGALATDGQVFQIRVVGEIAYLANGLGGLEIVDISDPRSPELISDISDIGEIKGIAVMGDRVYTCGTERGSKGSVIGFDVSDPRAPRKLAMRRLEIWSPFIAIEDTTGYVCNRKSGLVILDLRKANFIRRVSSTATGHEPFAVAIDGDTVYIADKEAGLTIMDVHLPRRPEVLSGMKLGGFAYGITLEGTTVYIAALDSGVQVVDVSDPKNPKVIDRVDTPDRAYQIAVVGRYGYVADGNGGLRVIEFARD